MNLESTKNTFILPEYSIVTSDAHNFEGIQTHEEDHFVISTTIKGSSIVQILVDEGSYVNVMYWTCFDQLQVPAEALKSFPGVLPGFSEQGTEVCGYFDLQTMFIDQDHEKTVTLQYMVVKLSTPLNEVSTTEW